MYPRSIILIVGPAGAGKSTVAEELAKHFERSAIVSVDPIRHMIRRGKVRPFPVTEEGERQLALAVKNACSLANSFHQEGYTVIVDDVVSVKERLDMYIDLLVKKPKIFLLLPSKKVSMERDVLRSEENQMRDHVIELHDRFTERAKEETRWKVIDSSRQTAIETVDEILTEIDRKG